MIPFRQVIRPGDKGRDVRAVKRTMRKMNVPGIGRVAVTNFAGDEFVAAIRRVQRHGGVKVDGIYGKGTHHIVAPKMDAYSRWLYRTAKIRHHTPPGTNTTAAAAAQQLLKYYEQGKWHPDNAGDLPQVRAAAQGKAVWSQGGYYVHIDKRVFEMLNWLISKGYKIGTYAICSDHGNDGPHGHAGGKAVDISSINGTSINSQSTTARDLTRKISGMLHSDIQQSLRPWQLISGGYGYMPDSTCLSHCIPSAAFYGYATVAEHRNHIHVGYN